MYTLHKSRLIICCNCTKVKNKFPIKIWRQMACIFTLLLNKTGFNQNYKRISMAWKFGIGFGDIQWLRGQEKMVGGPKNL